MKTPKLKQWQKIEIVWVDSCHTSGWRNSSDFTKDKKPDEPLWCSTMGYFIGYSPRSIKVVQSKQRYIKENGSSSVDAMMQIPKVAIISLRKL